MAPGQGRYNKKYPPRGGGPSKGFKSQRSSDNGSYYNKTYQNNYNPAYSKETSPPTRYSSDSYYPGSNYSNYNNNNNINHDQRSMANSPGQAQAQPIHVSDSSPHQEQAPLDTERPPYDYGYYAQEYPAPPNGPNPVQGQDGQYYDYNYQYDNSRPTSDPRNANNNIDNASNGPPPPSDHGRSMPTGPGDRYTTAPNIDPPFQTTESHNPSAAVYPPRGQTPIPVNESPSNPHIHPTPNHAPNHAPNPYPIPNQGPIPVPNQNQGPIPIPNQARNSVPAPDINQNNDTFEEPHNAYPTYQEPLDNSEMLEQYSAHSDPQMNFPDAPQGYIPLYAYNELNEKLRVLRSNYSKMNEKYEKLKESSRVQKNKLEAKVKYYTAKRSNSVNDTDLQSKFDEIKKKNETISADLEKYKLENEQLKETCSQKSESSNLFKARLLLSEKQVLELKTKISTKELDSSSNENECKSPNLKSLIMLPNDATEVKTEVKTEDLNALWERKEYYKNQYCALLREKDIEQSSFLRMTEKLLEKYVYNEN